MRKKKKDALAGWVDAIVARRHHGYSQTFEPKLAGWNLEAVGSVVKAGGHLIAIAESSTFSSTRVHILNDPPMGAVFATAYLMRILRQRGVPYYAGPRRTNDLFDRASIYRDSIEVLDTAGPIGPLEFPDALMRAETKASGGYTGKRIGDYRYTRRSAYFLMGTDRQDGTFFFCELPPDSEPVTVADAYQALKPPSVVEAEKQGLKVVRQGDIFAIEMLTYQPDPDQLVQERCFLLQTNHVADEAVMYGRMTYARGTMRHRPAGRNPDHRPLRLGKRWHLIVKNTVPLAR